MCAKPSSKINDDNSKKIRGNFLREYWKYRKEAAGELSLRAYAYRIKEIKKEASNEI